MRGNSLAQFLGGTEAQASRPTRCAKKYKLNLKDEENFVIIDYLKMSERLSCEGRNKKIKLKNIKKYNNCLLLGHQHPTFRFNRP